MTDQHDARGEPMRAHVEGFAARCGWEKSSGEGAFEFVQRKCYHQGWQDGRREALGDVHRDTPEVAAAPSQSAVQPLSEAQIEFAMPFCYDLEDFTAGVRFAEFEHGIVTKEGT